MVNNSEASGFNEDSRQRCDSNMSSENVSRPISFQIEECICSDNEETESDIQHGKWIKAGTEQPHFPFAAGQT